MIENTPGYDVIADFWEWYRRREDRQCGPIASHALNKCEEMFARGEWDSFGHWHAIYVRERRRERTGKIRASIALSRFKGIS